MTSRLISLFVIICATINCTDALGKQKDDDHERYPTYCASRLFGAVEIDEKDYIPLPTYMFYPDTVFYVLAMEKYVSIHEMLSKKQDQSDRIRVEYIQHCPLKKLADSVYVAWEGINLPGHHDVYEPLLTDSTIEYSQRHHADSIVVTLNLPNNVNDLEISVYYFNHKFGLAFAMADKCVYGGIVKTNISGEMKSATIKIPNSAENFFYAIRNLNIEPQGNFGMYYGRIEVPSYTGRPILTHNADITISLPNFCKYNFTEPFLPGRTFILTEGLMITQEDYLVPYREHGKEYKCISDDITYTTLKSYVDEYRHKLGTKKIVKNIMWDSDIFSTKDQGK